MPSKSTLAVLLIPAFILLIPLVAMQFTDEVDWSLSDFVLMYGLMTGIGGAFKFVASRSTSLAYRAGAAVACGTAFFLTWVNLAVEVIGDDNAVNALYFLVVLLGLLGAGAARFRAAGMARAMFAMAAAQMLVPTVGVIVNPNNFSPGILPVYVLNGGFAALFIFAGLLFSHAARDQGAPAREQLA
jgi:hypothetical protein